MTLTTFDFEAWSTRRTSGDFRPRPRKMQTSMNARLGRTKK
jgi:hypothetical protein